MNAIHIESERKTIQKLGDLSLDDIKSIIVTRWGKNGRATPIVTLNQREEIGYFLYLHRGVDVQYNSEWVEYQSTVSNSAYIAFTVKVKS